MIYLLGVSIVGLHAKSRLSIISHAFELSLAGSAQDVGRAYNCRKYYNVRNIA